MLYRKPSPVIGIVVGASFVAYHAGENLHYATPSPSPLIGIATAASTTASASAIVLTSPMSVAKIEPPPPVVPPNQKFEQG
jgi:hypothetical protein